MKQLEDEDLRTVHLVTSVLLGYPDDRLYEARPVLRRAVNSLPYGRPARRLTRFLDHLDATPTGELAAHYVATFDLKRRCCPYLTYYTYGDTRRRGTALLRFKQALRAAGFEPAVDELPDHLAVVCELSARGATREAGGLLREHQAAIELLHHALRAEPSPYADVVAAVLATLAPLGLRDQAAVAVLAARGPAAEQVGLEPFALSGVPR